MSGPSPSLSLLTEMIDEIRKYLTTSQRITFRRVNKYYHKLDEHYYVPFEKKELPAEWNFLWFEKYVAIGPYLREIMMVTEKPDEWSINVFSVDFGVVSYIFPTSQHNATWVTQTQRWSLYRIIGHPYDDVTK